jgi:hypothetical protein
MGYYLRHQDKHVPDLDLQHLIQLKNEQRECRDADHRGWTPSRRSWSQGRPRLDTGEAAVARGRRCHERCGREPGGGTVYVGSRRRSSAAAVAELPTTPVLPRVGLGFVGWGVWWRGEPRTASHGPHPLFIPLCDGDPPTMDWLGAPTRARERARCGLWVVTEERSNQQ